MSLQEFMNRENDYTIRLRNKDLPKEDQDIAFYLHLDGDSCMWVLLTLKRAPLLRALSKGERKRLWSNRWRVVDRKEFKIFSEAKLGLMQRAQVLIPEKYRITSMTTVFDLPPW